MTAVRIFSTSSEPPHSITKLTQTTKKLKLKKSKTILLLNTFIVKVISLQVVTFKPDGTNDALHFYINGREMDIDVIVSASQSGTKSKF